jgi:hypothetical protein
MSLPTTTSTTSSVVADATGTAPSKTSIGPSSAAPADESTGALFASVFGPRRGPSTADRRAEEQALIAQALAWLHQETEDLARDGQGTALNQRMTLDHLSKTERSLETDAAHTLLDSPHGKVARHQLADLGRWAEQGVGCMSPRTWSPQRYACASLMEPRATVNGARRWERVTSCLEGEVHAGVLSEAESMAATNRLLKALS